MIANTTTSNVVYPVANAAASTNPFVDVFNTRDPTTADVQYPVQKKWFNTSTNSYSILIGFTTVNGIVLANWQRISAGSIFETLTGNTGPVVPPTANNINVVGDGISVTTSGNAGTSTLTISVLGDITTTYVCNSGSATASAGTLNVLGAGASSTTGAGNTITITTTAPGTFMWSDKSSSFNAAAFNGYFVTGVTTATMPATPSEGDTIAFIVDDTNILTIQANTGQKIRIASTISATAGTAASNAQGDSVVFIYRTVGTTWLAQASQGTWTVT